MVPVLSKKIVVTSFIFWIVSPDRIKIPCSAPRPLPTINAVGVANPSAQGQAMTKTAIETKSADPNRVKFKLLQLHY
mgnify:CR=1 FL=1